MEERNVIGRVKAGDAAAFALLYDNYWLKVYNFTQFYIVSSDDVAEIVQDVFVKVWEARHLLDETKNFDGLLFIITRNLVFNYTRRNFNELNFRMTALCAIEGSYDMEEELDATDLKEYIDTLILQLPPQRQKIFRMSREKNLTNKEIANCCAITEKAVEKNITFALKFLRDNLPLFLLFMRW